MIRVMLVDDHEMVRSGFRMILSKQADIEVVAEASRGDEAVVLAKKLKPDVVLMDVHMPGISGVEATERILRHSKSIRVIAVTGQVERPFPKRFLEMGASGYLTKACPAKELVAAIRSVHRGDRVLSADVAQVIALDAVSSLAGQSSPFEALSAREIEVALKLTEGQSIQAIAEKLSLSPKTVATYKYRLYEKLNVSSEIALANLAVEYGFVSRAGQGLISKG
jgi:two-component system invasion response regulator UvrY